MTPDELRALAEQTYQRATFFREESSCTNVPYSPLTVIALCEAAREHADLREWAERAQAIMAMLMAAPPDQAREISALLAEYAERWGNT